MKHRFKPIGISDTGWPEFSMVIEVEELRKQTIDQLVRYLIDHIDEIGPEVQRDPDRMFPVKILVGGEIELSEQLLWQLVIENSSCSEDFVVAYIDTLRDLVAKNGLYNTFFSSEKYFSGSYAIYTYLDYFLETDSSTTPTTYRVYDAFYSYLKLCDLEFEVHQDDYITKVLGKLRTLSQEKYLELLYFRLFTGQASIGSRDFRYLNQIMGEKQLKNVIDYIIQKHDKIYVEENRPHEIYEFMHLLASVYGTDENRIDEVISYISDKVTASFEEKPYRLSKSIRRIQLECDAYRETCSATPGFLDSGFHKYDTQTKQWMSYEAGESRGAFITER